MNLYVGNLSYDMSERELATTFGEYGQVTSARLVMDRESGRPRGFGFVEMADKKSGLSAIEALHNQEISGRRIIVNEARAKAGR